MSRRTIAILLALALQSSPASAQYIGIFLDAEATSCVAQVGGTPFIDLHIVAVIDGDIEMDVVQFQITGAPEGWTPQNALWVPDVGVVVGLGHPLFPTPVVENSGGAILAFGGACYDTPGVQVPLGRVILLGAPTPENVHLRVEGFELVPPDPDCPFFVNCTYTEKVCVGGGDAFLNGSGPSSCGPVAVAAETWTSVKALFQ